VQIPVPKAETRASLTSIISRNQVRDLLKEASAEVGGHKFSLQFFTDREGTGRRRVAIGDLGNLSGRSAAWEKDASTGATARHPWSMKRKTSASLNYG